MMSSSVHQNGTPDWGCGLGEPHAPQNVMCCGVLRPQAQRQNTGTGSGGERRRFDRRFIGMWSLGSLFESVMLPPAITLPRMLIRFSPIDTIP